MDSDRDNDIPHLLDPEPVAALLRGDGAAEGLWSDADLPGIWFYQLTAPLPREFEHYGGASVLLVQSLCNGVEPPIRNLRDLIAHPAPPLQLLQLVKDMAKREVLEPEPLLPRPAAGAIYHVAIVLARVRLGQSISGLPDGKLLAALHWVRARKWIDSGTCATLQELIERFAALSTEAGQPIESQGRDDVAPIAFG